MTAVTRLLTCGGGGAEDRMSGVKMKNTPSGPWRSDFTYLYKYATTSERCQNEPWTLRMLSTDWAGRRKCQGFTSLTFSTGINNINSYGEACVPWDCKGSGSTQEHAVWSEWFEGKMVLYFFVKVCYTLYCLVLKFCWHLLLHEIIYSICLIVNSSSKLPQWLAVFVQRRYLRRILPIKCLW